jgi:hypothetical protein
MTDTNAREKQIVGVLVDAFEDLIDVEGIYE